MGSQISGADEGLSMILEHNGFKFDFSLLQSFDVKETLNRMIQLIENGQDFKRVEMEAYRFLREQRVCDIVESEFKAVLQCYDEFLKTK